MKFCVLRFTVFILIWAQICQNVVVISQNGNYPKSIKGAKKSSSQGKPASAGKDQKSSAAQTSGTKSQQVKTGATGTVKQQKQNKTGTTGSFKLTNATNSTIPTPSPIPTPKPTPTPIPDNKTSAKNQSKDTKDNNTSDQKSAATIDTTENCCKCRFWPWYWPSYNYRYNCQAPRIECHYRSSPVTYLRTQSNFFPSFSFRSYPSFRRFFYTNYYPIYQQRYCRVINNSNANINEQVNQAASFEQSLKDVLYSLLGKGEKTDDVYQKIIQIFNSKKDDDRVQRGRPTPGAVGGDSQQAEDEYEDDEYDYDYDDYQDEFDDDYDESDNIDFDDEIDDGEQYQRDQIQGQQDQLPQKFPKLIDQSILKQIFNQISKDEGESKDKDMNQYVDEEEQDQLTGQGSQNLIQQEQQVDNLVGGGTQQGQNDKDNDQQQDAQKNDDNQQASDGISSQVDQAEDGAEVQQQQKKQEIQQANQDQLRQQDGGQSQKQQKQQEKELEEQQEQLPKSQAPEQNSIQQRQQQNSQNQQSQVQKEDDSQSNQISEDKQNEIAENQSQIIQQGQNEEPSQSEQPQVPADGQNS